MKCLKNIFPVFLSISLIISFSVTSANGESSKTTRRYRSKVSKSNNQFANIAVPSLVQNDTNSEIYPSPTISSSRAMPVTGLASDFETEREEDMLQPFNNDFNTWGNHRVSTGSSSSGSKQSSLKESSNSAFQPAAPRYTTTSAEKFASKDSNNYGLGSTGASQVYSSYPLGGSGGSYSSNPLMDTFPFYERERERTARDLLLTHAAAVNKLNALNSLGVNPAVAAAAASSLFGNAVVPPVDFDGYGDALALASGGGHGGGHGWGWGWKEPEHHHDHGYGSQVNTNAIGLLGLLGLLSLLSNVILILATVPTTTAAGRRKRSASFSRPELNGESEEAKRQRIFYEVLPYLSPVAHARNGLIPTECTLTGVCMANKILVKEYGLTARPAGNRVTVAIAKLLGEVDNTEDHTKQFEMAGLYGRNQKNCEKIYPVCMSLQNGDHSIPFKIRMEQVPHLFEKLKKQTSYSPMHL